MPERIPMSEKLYEKLEDSIDTLHLYVDWIEEEYRKNGRDGSFENVFSNMMLTEAYIRTLIETIQKEAPYHYSDPAEAFKITDDLGDFLHALREDRLQEGMEALGEAVADIDYVLDEY